MNCSPPATLSVGFSRQECWSGLPCPSPGDLPNPRIKPTSLMSPALAGRFFTSATKLAYDLAIPLLGIHQKGLRAGPQMKRYWHSHVHSSISHDREKGEATRMSTDKWMAYQNVVYSYNGKLFSLKKERNSAICYNMVNLEDIILSEISQSQKDK